MRFSDYVNIAVRASKDVFNHRFKHGCVIFKNDNLISIGRNNKICLAKLRKLGYKNDTIHAETDAILKAKSDDLRGASLIVVRCGKTKLCNSKPCARCINIITMSGIKNIYYSDCDGEIKHIRL